MHRFLNTYYLFWFIPDCKIFFAGAKSSHRASNLSLSSPPPPSPSTLSHFVSLCFYLPEKRRSSGGRGGVSLPLCHNKTKALAFRHLPPPNSKHSFTVHKKEKKSRQAFFWKSDWHRNEYISVQIKEWKNEDMNLEVFFFCIYLHVSLCVCLCVCVFVSLPVSTGQCSGSHNRMNKFFLRHCWVSHTPLWLISYPVIMFGGRRKKKKQTLILFNCVKLSKKKTKTGLPNPDVTRFNPGHPRSPRRRPRGNKLVPPHCFHQQIRQDFSWLLNPMEIQLDVTFFFFPPRQDAF